MGITTFTRTEMNKKYGLNKHYWETRKSEVIAYLNEFMEVKERLLENGRYVYDIEGDVPESIPTIPRKNARFQKEEDYENYVVKKLPDDFKPNSKSRMARMAIEDFGYKKYGHFSSANIAKMYVGPAMEKNGEKSEKRVWVHSSTYELLNEEELAMLNATFTKFRVTKEEIYRTFVDTANKDKEVSDKAMDKKKRDYKSAIMEFKDRYGDVPVYVHGWKVRESIKKKEFEQE